MRTQGGVKSIAMGGRPIAGPIQGLGGIKGAESLGFEDVWKYAQLASKNGTLDQQKNSRQTEPASYLQELIFWY
jgi:hypothetical protein